MFGSVTGWSLQFRYLVLIAAAALTYFGVTQFRSQPIDILPDFAPLTVEVRTEALGLAPAEVESLITVPLEEILSGVPWLETMQSRSIEGLSSTTLSFEEGTSMLKARQMVQERLLTSSILPKVSKPPVMLQPVSDLNRAMQIGLSSDKLSLTDVSLLARWKIKPRLMSVPGVANVAIWGQRERQLQVAVDVDKLHAKGLQLQDVIKAAGEALWVSPLTYLRASTPGTGGFIDTPTQRYDIRHVLPISSPSDLARVTFQAKDGTQLTLGDVASVIEGHQPLIGDGVVDGAPGLMLVVEKLPGADTPAVTAGIERALEALAPGLPGVAIHASIYRPATYIQSSLHNLWQVLVVGAALIALVLYAMFRDWRATVVALAAIALSLLTGWLVLFLLRVNANIMVLGGLAIAATAVVDDAVTGVHGILQKLRQGAGRSVASEILAATVALRSPLLAVTVIIALIAFPIAFMTGAVSMLLYPMLLACLAALLATTLVAYVITPVLCLLLYPATAKSAADAAAPGSALQTRYQHLLAPVTAAPRNAISIALLVALAGLIALMMAPKAIVPTLMDRDLVIAWEAAPGTSYPAMSALVSEATRKIKALPGIRDVGGHVGRALQSDRSIGVNSAELWVSMAADANYGQTVEFLRQALAGYSGKIGEPQSYATLRLGQAIKPATEMAAVRIYGPNWDVLEAKAAEAQKALAVVPGIANPRVRDRVDKTNLKIEVDLDKARKFGIKPGDVRRGIATLMAGIEVGSLYEEQKIFEVIVWGTDKVRHDVEGLRNLTVDSPNGAVVRLGDVATVSEVKSPSIIDRQNASRYLDVVADASGTASGDLPAKIKAAIAGVSMPLEYHFEVLARESSLLSTRNWVIGASIAAALGILLLLQTLLGSWSRAAIGWLTTAGAVSGGALAASIGTGVISFGSLIGLAAVALIAARQSTLLMRAVPDIGGGAAELAAIDTAAADHLLPVLTTTLCLAALALTIIFFGNGPGLEVLQPMAIAVLGGTIASALLSLLVVPGALVSLPCRLAGETATARVQLATQGAY